MKNKSKIKILNSKKMKKVLHHVENLEVELKEIHRVLAPGYLKF